MYRITADAEIHGEPPPGGPSRTARRTLAALDAEIARRRAAGH